MYPFRAPSAHRLFDSGEEVSPVIGVACLNQHFVFALCVHVQICLKSKNCSCISFCRYKHQALSKKLCGLLVKPSSLRLQRGVKCGRKIHGRSVVSFTMQKSFVKCIRVSELHLTACSLTDALLTSSPPCASVSNGVSPAPPTVHTPPSLSCAPKTCGTP